MQEPQKRAHDVAARYIRDVKEIDALLRDVPHTSLRYVRRKLVLWRTSAPPGKTQIRQGEVSVQSLKDHLVNVLV